MGSKVDRSKGWVVRAGAARGAESQSTDRSMKRPYSLSRITQAEHGSTIRDHAASKARNVSSPDQPLRLRER